MRDEMSRQQHAAYMREYRQHLSESQRAKVAAVQLAYRATHKTEQAAYDKAYKATHRKEKQAYFRAWYASHKGQYAEYTQRYQNTHREVIRVRGLARQAVLNGALIPQPCSACRAVCAEMHHPDYSKPLAVVWLCRSCHARLHRGAQPE